MGLFDGLGSTTYSSTANISKLLNAPVIFILDAKGQVASLLATVRGFRDFDSELSIAGIIFNNVNSCLLYTSPSPRDATLSRMPSSA